MGTPPIASGRPSLWDLRVYLSFKARIESGSELKKSGTRLVQVLFVKWRARSWRVPKLFFKAPGKARAALLRGYFDAEAYVQRSPRRIEVHTCNLNGLSDIRALLKSLEIGARIYAMSTGRSWKLHIPVSSLAKFERSIGFAIRHKQDTLHQIANHGQLTGIFKNRAT